MGRRVGREEHQLEGALCGQTGLRESASAGPYLLDQPVASAYLSLGDGWMAAPGRNPVWDGCTEATAAHKQMQAE